MFILGTLVSFIMLRFGFVACSASMHLRPDYDLNVYYLIGNAWMRGHLPYVEYCDLKGPLVFLFHGVCSLLTPGSFLGACLLHAPIVGIGLLYAYKSARLFLPALPAAGVSGFYVFFLLYFAVHPAEQVWTMQHVTLYWLLQWARGDKTHFSRSRLLFLGCFVASTLLMKFNLVMFWVPVCLWACWVVGWQALAWQGLGFSLVMVPFLGYFWLCGSLVPLWNEYVGIALAYGCVPFTESALYVRNFLLFRGIAPFHLYNVVPDEVLALFGCVPCLSWPLLWRAKPLNSGTLWVLVAAFVLQVYAAYSGKYDFLHYAFVFFPYCFLSLVLVVCWATRYARCLCIMGILVASGTVGVAVALPLYVKYARPNNGNAQIGKTSSIVADWMRSQAEHHCLILDAETSLHLYRLSGRLPGIRHFVPPIVSGGEKLYRDEQVAYIRREQPRYLLGSAWKKEAEQAVIAASGVQYSVQSHRELGYPAYPAHARQPELILYTRVDE